MIQPNRKEKWYIDNVFIFLLMGYLLIGKMYATLHIPFTPIYIGEIFMIFGLYRLKNKPVRVRHFYFIVIFIFIGLCNLAVNVGKFKLEAVRDFAMIYYSVFFIIGYYHVSERNIESFKVTLLKCIKYVLPALLLIQVIKRTFKEALQNLTYEDVALFATKSGDIQVYLALFSALLISSPRNKIIRYKNIYYLMCGILLVTTASLNRGGFVAFCIALIIGFRHFNFRQKVNSIYILAFALMIVFSGIEIVDRQSSSGGRQVSITQLRENIISLFSSDTNNAGRTQGTKRWRKEFWSTLIAEVTESPSKMWFGLGLGPNLITQFEQFAVDDEDSERKTKHPHNYTINIFSRLGLVGLFGWLFVLFCFLRKAIPMLLFSKKRPMLAWSFSLLVIAGLINSNFDVYLENPMGAIIFWISMGIAYKCLKIENRAKSVGISQPSQQVPRFPLISTP
ncbi:O-antigen ligase [Dyadobacter sp. CY343]|uniref:O-antigen ligase family protein n=1 Tax=Dyadobacter sp. CY343 TaxID=2907299 RepID=UPI001F32A3A6|nr:O-antigen ligase family protein [Dyadobacter sp. CY343]MCE7059704.1 O-antigen ligase family protein [Dyadobacter sp. CY343]